MLILLVLCFLIIGIIIGYMISYFKEKNYKLLLINYTEELKVEKISLATTLSQKQDQVLNLSNQLIAYKMEVDNHLARIKEQKQDIITMKNQFTHEFENLANRIFFDASNKFSEQNRVNLGNLLTPLGEKIKDFEGKVHDVYEKICSELHIYKYEDVEYLVNNAINTESFINAIYRVAIASPSTY